MNRQTKEHRHLTIVRQMRKKSKEIFTLLKRLEKAEEEYIDLKETTKANNAITRHHNRIDLLDERDRQIIAYRQQGLSLREIAPLVGMTYGSVKHISARISRITNEIDNLTCVGNQTNKVPKEQSTE